VSQHVYHTSLLLLFLSNKNNNVVTSMFDCILGTCYICTSNTYHIQFTSAVVLIVNVLACKSIHCDRLIFSMFSQFAGFSAESLSSRILDAKCDILVTAGKVVLWTDLFSLPCLQSD